MRLKMLSEGPLGSEITPLRSLLGPLWYHLGPNLVPFRSKMPPPGTPWVPQVSAKAPQSHSLWHKSSPEGPQGRPGCPPAPHFGRFSVIWGGHSEGFGVPLGVTSGEGGSRLGPNPSAGNFEDPLAITTPAVPPRTTFFPGHRAELAIATWIRAVPLRHAKRVWGQQRVH